MKRAHQSTNLVKFHVSSRKSKILHFDGFLLSRSYKVSAKKVQKSYHDAEKFEGKFEGKFKGKLTRGLKNDERNLVNFHASSRNCENLHFDGLLLSKAYKVLDEKVQKSYDCDSEE